MLCLTCSMVPSVDFVQFGVLVLKIQVPEKFATNTFLLRMSEYAVVFATLDRKGRGTVSRDDVIRALQILQLNPTLEEVECLLQKYQQHGNNAQGSIQK